MKKTLGLTIAIIFLCNSLAFAGLDGTIWCNPDGYYFEETGMTYPCRAFYRGQIFTLTNPMDMVIGLAYIDLDPYFIFWMSPVFLMFGSFMIAIGKYSISEGTLSYAAIGLNFLVPFYGEVTLILSNTDEAGMSLKGPIVEPEGCL